MDKESFYGCGSMGKGYKRKLLYSGLSAICVFGGSFVFSSSPLQIPIETKIEESQNIIIGEVEVVSNEPLLSSKGFKLIPTVHAISAEELFSGKSRGVEERRDIYYDIKVQKVYKGSYKVGENIEIKGVTYAYNDAMFSMACRALNTGQNYLLFIEDGEVTDCSGNRVKSISDSFTINDAEDLLHENGLFWKSTL